MITIAAGATGTAVQTMGGTYTFTCTGAGIAQFSPDNSTWFDIKTFTGKDCQNVTVCPGWLRFKSTDAGSQSYDFTRIPLSQPLATGLPV